MIGTIGRPCEEVIDPPSLVINWNDGACDDYGWSLFVYGEDREMITLPLRGRDHQIKELLATVPHRYGGQYVAVAGDVYMVPVLVEDHDVVGTYALASPGGDVELWGYPARDGQSPVCMAVSTPAGSWQRVEDGDVVPAMYISSMTAEELRGGRVAVLRWGDA